MGGVLTEHLAASGIPMSYATPAGQASAWTIMTNELPLVARALARRNVSVTTLSTVSAFDGQSATLKHVFTGEETRVVCENLLIVGLRKPRTELFDTLTKRQADVSAAGILSVDLIGDCLAPGALVHAVHSGHKLGRELGTADYGKPFLRDGPFVDEWEDDGAVVAAE